MHRVLVGAGDAVEYRDDAARVGVGLLDRPGKQQPREDAFPDAGKSATTDGSITVASMCAESAVSNGWTPPSRPYRPDCAL